MKHEKSSFTLCKLCYVKHKHDMDPNSNLNYRRKIGPLCVWKRGKFFKDNEQEWNAFIPWLRGNINICNCHEKITNSKKYGIFWKGGKFQIE